MALAGMTGCTKALLEPIVPYVKATGRSSSRRPMFYATAMTLGGYASPLLVESHLGRPTKIEGNPEPSCERGRLPIFSLRLRCSISTTRIAHKTVTNLGDNPFVAALCGRARGPLNAQKGLGGAGIRILTQTVSFPSARGADPRDLGSLSSGQVARLRTGRSRQCDGWGADGVRSTVSETQHRFDAADVIVSLDADFLYAGFPGSARYIRALCKVDGILTKILIVST